MVFSKKLSEFSDQDQLDLWYELIGTRQLYKPVLSPFRTDSKPGGNVYLDYWRGKYRITDFSYRDLYHNLDVFDAIKLKYGFNQSELLDFLKNKSYHPSPKKVKESIDKKCYINFQPFDGYYKSTIEYFKTYGISQEQLWADGVRNAHSLIVNHYNKKQGERAIFHFHPKKCHAIYTFPSGNCKIYQPLEEDRFPLSNTNKEDVWKIDNGSDKLIITTSYKDARVTSNLCSQLVNVIAPQSESLPLELKNSLYDDAWIKEHKEILIIGDNDACGMRFSQRLSEYLGAIGFEYPEGIEKINKYGKKNKDLSEIWRHLNN